MHDIITVFIIFTALATIVIVPMVLNYKKYIYELELRREELRNGCPPGTYSNAKIRRRSRKQASQVNQEDSIIKENIVLEREIDDLMSRIENIETIYRSKNEN